MDVPHTRPTISVQPRHESAQDWHNILTYLNNVLTHTATPPDTSELDDFESTIRNSNHNFLQGTGDTAEGRAWLDEQLEFAAAQRAKDTAEHLQKNETVAGLVLEEIGKMRRQIDVGEVDFGGKEENDGMKRQLDALAEKAYALGGPSVREFAAALEQEETGQTPGGLQVRGGDFSAQHSCGLSLAVHTASEDLLLTSHQEQPNFANQPANQPNNQE